MTEPLISKLWNLIEPRLEADGIELVELEFRFETGRWVLRLYIDRPSGVNLDDCEICSRQISALLDIEDPIEQSYTLEVSSPGINRALRKLQDFERFAGNSVKIKTTTKIGGRRNFAGLLKGLRNSNIVVELEGMEVEIQPELVEKARLDLNPEKLFRNDLRRGTVQTGE
ncbi:MAG: ribosome maturation factor RimP [Desulfomonilaceae bacterium]